MTTSAWAVVEQALPDWITKPGGAPTLAARMGITLTEADPQRLVATMPVEGNRQLFGVLHGGASLVLAETLGSIGAAMHVGNGHAAFGVDINATHHRPARSGLVTGVATALSLARGSASYNVTITDESGDLLCTSRITCATNARRRED